MGPPLDSVHAQISPILDNTLLMKADLVNTVPVAACFVTVDNGWGLETVKQRMQFNFLSNTRILLEYERVTGTQGSQYKKQLQVILSSAEM